MRGSLQAAAGRRLRARASGSTRAQRCCRDARAGPGGGTCSSRAAASAERAQACSRVCGSIAGCSLAWVQAGPPCPSPDGHQHWGQAVLVLPTFLIPETRSSLPPRLPSLSTLQRLQVCCPTLANTPHQPEHLSHSAAQHAAQGQRLAGQDAQIPLACVASEESRPS